MSSGAGSWFLFSSHYFQPVKLTNLNKLHTCITDGGYISHHSNMPCLHLHTMHVFHVLCLLPTLTTVEGTKDLVICLSTWTCSVAVSSVCVQVLERSWLTDCCLCVVWKSYTFVTSTLHQCSAFCQRTQGTALCQPWGWPLGTILNW